MPIAFMSPPSDWQSMYNNDCRLSIWESHGLELQLLLVQSDVLQTLRRRNADHDDHNDHGDLRQSIPLWLATEHDGVRYLELLGIYAMLLEVVCLLHGCG